ncbi:MAG: 5-formyltetrahydrofolate cyclo-ligase [Actinomycetales bacterium]|nr:5-formyltetrahydrofolate cyclo-ligase [Actinomycetales bacterium]
MTEVTGVPEAKRALRSQIRAARRERVQRVDLGAAAGALADAALAVVGALPGEGQRVCRVAAYQALATEPPTDVLIAALRTARHEVILPVLQPDRSLTWDLDGRALPADALGACDLVLAPALAVDQGGRRLGQGGGSYDRALASARTGTPVLALVWDEEVLEAGSVPTEPHDRPVDGVLTPAGGVVLFRTSVFGTSGFRASARG